jgi:Zn-finger protein
MISIDDRNEAQTVERGAENSARFFRNTRCEHFPCHDLDARQFNCLFCFCPMYHMECLSEPGHLETQGVRIKDCSRCDYPHRPENYERIIRHVASSSPLTEGRSTNPADDRIPEGAAGEEQRCG